MKKKACVKVAPKKGNVKKHKVDDARRRILEREKIEEDLISQELRRDESQGFYHLKHHREKGHLGKSVTHETAPTEREKKIIEHISKLDEESRAEIIRVKRERDTPTQELRKLTKIRRALEVEETHIKRMEHGQLAGKRKVKLSKEQIAWLKRRDRYLKTQIAKLDSWIGKLAPKKPAKVAKRKVTKRPVSKRSARNPQKSKVARFLKSKPRKLQKAA